MPKKLIQAISRDMNDRLTEKTFLRRMGLKKKGMLDLLKEEDWQEKIREALQRGGFSCRVVLDFCQKTMSRLSPEEPKEGWLTYIYRYLSGELFPDTIALSEKERYEKAVLFYLTVLKIFLGREGQIAEKLPENTFDFLTKEELAVSENKEEYLLFLERFDKNYMYELMRIGGEVAVFQALVHVAGVHGIAMHTARQLAAAGVPIDLGLVSAAAATHDIGKYGCKVSEIKRIPYLHYYYTDQWLKRNGMPTVAHIASNHSTWDLELENLPVESLVLIYADFRVKSDGMVAGKERIRIFTLKEAFSVILNKLDNVDKVKEDRYRHVYTKLADFEDYMVSLGVDTTLLSKELSPVDDKDAALLSHSEAAERLKFMAISHNIRLMNKLGSEVSFGNVLEAARSEKNWKNSRAYINLFEEYFTYMTKKQKLQTLSFLSELLMHREGDIRRQAAGLMGNIIVNFDEEYRKELPEGVTKDQGEMTGLQLWTKYLKMILYPDHKVTDQHRRWIGYALKSMVESVLTRCTPEQRRGYLELLVQEYEEPDAPELTAFILMDTALILPIPLLLPEETEVLLNFTERISELPTPEIRTGIMRFLKYLSEQAKPSPGRKELAKTLLERICADNGEELSYNNSQKLLPTNNAGLCFLACCICENWELSNTYFIEYYQNEIQGNESVISDIFLDNLKTVTPWVIKAVNIELLLDIVKAGKGVHVLHVAAHFSNLLKVSERVAVRHSAGRALLEIAPLLSRDQRNEVAIELWKGLETGEYEFSKYIPQYLGEFMLYLFPMELDEIIGDLSRLLVSTNDRIVCVTLDTLGILLQNYSVYEGRFKSDSQTLEARKKRLLGMLLSGLANYAPSISQEAFLVIGQYLFAGQKLSLSQRMELFAVLCKKLLTLVPEREAGELDFFNSAASLNHIYRFINEYLFVYGSFPMEERKKAAFFPGTFDPFSLSHKQIVRKIRDLGFTVYMALDEFSWSKKTQPRMIRRQIITMSIADEEEIYMFPDDIPVNIANPRDLARLRQMFTDRELYLVVGSDVVQNASSYRKPPAKNSVHSMNHIIFLRDSQINGSLAEEVENPISGKVVTLKLPMHLEDISSSRIRENVDHNRDISNLIDPVVQNYIYENNLYLREPQYKPILQAKTVQLSVESKLSEAFVEELLGRFADDFQSLDKVKADLGRKGACAAVLRDEKRGNGITGVLVFRQISTTELYGEFRDTSVVNYIREHTSGKMVLINGILIFGKTEVEEREQLLLTEALAYCLKKDFTYCIYGSDIMEPPEIVRSLLARQGFLPLARAEQGASVYAVDMKSPITLFKNIETAVKEPFNHSPRVRAAIDKAHWRMQETLTKLYPGSLVLSFNASVMHHRLVSLITAAGGVPAEPLPVRKLGNSMCVPFGKILRGVAIPNTVTKALHTEKAFGPDVKSFRITEYPNYSPLSSQIRTIKSFDRPVVLVDDLLHKGYRIRELDPLFKKEKVSIDRIIVGILSGRGKDLMTIQSRKVESVYFLPNLRIWFVESSMYPFIGGDMVQRQEKVQAGLINSVNMILPYVMPGFLTDASRTAIYRLSMTCLLNARDILKALEEEYQQNFERKLTLNRLGEVVISPSRPDRGSCLTYDNHLAASAYVESDIEALKRLSGLVKE